MYTPDCWKIVRFTSDQYGIVDKILAGWYGGYLSGDTWRISSGITGFIEDSDGFYNFRNDSGSIYHCDPKSERMTAIMQQAFDSWLSQLLTSTSTVETIDFKDWNTSDR